MTLRVSEVYQSVQGEGPRVGQPTTFVRFGGCNLRCPGWPCDTPHAIFPGQYRQEWEKVSVDDLLDRIPLYPNNVCLTGGEPMLQPHEDLDALTFRLAKRFQHVEMFSNGTLPYTEAVNANVDIVMDWKLPGSGEGDNAFGIWNKLRIDNFYRLFPARDAVKFTISDKQDFEAALEVQNLHFHGQADWYPPQVYAGIVWGKKMTDAELVELILDHQLDWHLNVQVHNHIWDRTQRGI